MNSEQFVKAVKTQTSVAAVKGTIKCLKNPPGRKPAEHLIRLSKWYNGLTEEDHKLLYMAFTEVAEMAVFEFMCLLDGVSPIEDGPNKGDLELYYKKNEEKTLLNDPYNEELHNLYNTLCSIDLLEEVQNSEIGAYEQGYASDLKMKLKLGDELDIHNIPDKIDSLQTIKEYDPNKAPAIVLNKLEHRQIRKK